jgi:hypothetical protein
MGYDHELELQADVFREITVGDKRFILCQDAEWKKGEMILLRQMIDGKRGKQAASVRIDYIERPAEIPGYMVVQFTKWEQIYDVWF